MLVGIIVTVYVRQINEMGTVKSIEYANLNLINPK